MRNYIWGLISGIISLLANRKAHIRERGGGGLQPGDLTYDFTVYDVIQLHLFCSFTAAVRLFSISEF